MCAIIFQNNGTYCFHLTDGEKNPTLIEGPGIYLETRISYFILEEHPSNALTITLQDLSNQAEHPSNRIASYQSRRSCFPSTLSMALSVYQTQTYSLYMCL